MARHDEHTGTRIAAYRKLRGLSQRGLATRAHISYSLLTKVETGHRPASPALVAACARVLRVTSYDLTGQPYTSDLQRDRLDELLQPIRASLDNWDLPLGWEVPPRPVAEISADVDRVMLQRREARYAPMAQALPALIDELVQVTQTRHGRERVRAFSLLACLYRCVHTLAYKLGMVDLGTVALERMAWCAPLADDPCLPALRSLLRAQSTSATGRYDVGIRLIEATQQSLADVDTRCEHARAALFGALHLQGAMLAARSQDRAGAAERLEAAGALAETTGELGHYGLSWGPTNVAVHAVSAAVDLDQPKAAISLATNIAIPEGWSPSRAGHLWIDLSRAYLWTGRHEQTLHCLKRAREVAPQQARYHPAVRETVSAMVRHRRSVEGTVSAFAAWLGL